MKNIKEIKLIPIVCGMSGDSEDVKYDVKLVYDDGTEKFIAMEHTFNQLRNITIAILHEDILDQIRKRNRAIAHNIDVQSKGEKRMDIKKFADGFGEKMNDLYALDEKQSQIIEEAKKVVDDAFDQYVEELKDQVKLMTREDLQEYLDEASERGHSIHMQALVIGEFAETHEGKDKRAAENTLRILRTKMDLADLSDMLANIL